MNELHQVLHGLAIKKHATPDEVSAVASLTFDRTARLLEQAAASGRAVAAQGRYLLSAAGRMILEHQYPRYYAALRADRAFIGAYERFEMLNVELKHVITDWQTVEIGGERVRNDHTDPGYDERIIDRLGGVHDRVAPLLANLTQGLARLRRYGADLEAALAKAEDGDYQWVSDARIASYHTVWFELHEDLLRVLGRERQG